MPTLDWIGKKAVVKHHRDVPYRLLEPVPELSLGDGDSGNVLTGSVLANLPPHDGPKVVYAAACRLGRKRLSAENIVFKQTPYALEF